MKLKDFFRRRTSPVEGPKVPADFDKEVRAVLDAVRSYTMTSPERVYALVRGVEYTVKHSIPGAMVECGVWRGGSMMAVALTLLRLGVRDRDLYLFDTYAGMSQPSTSDGKVAMQKWQVNQCGQENKWCFASAAEVLTNLRCTGYPTERIHICKGKVEETLPGQAPGQIALLRLDTDWYESTLHELQHLYPRLSKQGILIIDDYGRWQGCRAATDEYFGRSGQAVFLSRIDGTGRLAVKAA